MLRFPKPKVLRPVRPNAGTEAHYRRRLYKLIAEMQDSVVYWVRASYNANEPKIAQDVLPSKALKAAVRKLARRWQRNFDDAAPKLADYYAQAAQDRSARQLQRILRDAGFSVKFKMTNTIRDVMNASIAEQVSLIRSIPSQYFTDVEGLVMRSVAKGGDMFTLAGALEQRYSVTRRRAALIARDQTNKATAVITRARQLEVGITEAVWLHSHGGKEPRPTHLANSGKRYDISKGWYDPDADGKGKGKYIFPGELINCRCVSKSIVEGLT